MEQPYFVHAMTDVMYLIYTHLIILILGYNSTGFYVTYFFYFTHAGDAEKSKAVSCNCSELSADLLWLTNYVKRNLSLLYILIVCLDTILILY